MFTQGFFIEHCDYMPVGSITKLSKHTLNINENFEQIIKLFASSTFAKKFQSL
jgi:hypothetical protein